MMRIRQASAGLFCRPGSRLFLLFVLLSVLFAGGACRSGSGDADEQSYRIYYRNVTQTALGTETRRDEETSPERIVEDLWNALCSHPRSNDLASAIPAGVILQKSSLVSNNLNLYFNEALNSLDTVQLLLFRAAVVRTFTQIGGVETVTFFVEDSPLTDANYMVLGAQSASDYIDIIGRGLSASQKTTLVLYYADGTGGRLVTRRREILYDNSYSLESDIISRLTRDIPEEGCYATIPSTVKVISLNNKNGTCYINFSPSFLTDALPISGYTIIYSIVNSLCELPEIQRVQILVEGRGDLTFKDEISLAAPLQPDLNY